MLRVDGGRLALLAKALWLVASSAMTILIWVVRKGRLRCFEDVKMVRDGTRWHEMARYCVAEEAASQQLFGKEAVLNSLEVAGDKRSTSRKDVFFC